MPNAKIGVLSGPSHAEEVSIGIPTVMVIASKHDEILYDVQDSFMSPEFRIYTSRDVRGVEIGGAFKNIIAFCAGVAAGIGLGDNSFAALITRGLTEISRLGVKMGGKLWRFLCVIVSMYRGPCVRLSSSLCSILSRTIFNAFK